MTDTKTNKKEILKYFAFIILGILIGYGFPYFLDDGGYYSSYKVDEASNKIFSVSKDSVSVEDQKAGNSVFIKSVAFVESGWVAIHEDLNGTPGNILGARRFNAGKSDGIVELLRNTIAGNKYYTILHRDDGDGEFDHTKDFVIYDSEENPVSVTFETFGE